MTKLWTTQDGLERAAREAAETNYQISWTPRIDAMPETTVGPREVEIHADLTPIQGPTLQQYFGPWLMLEERFMQEAQVVRAMDLTAHIKQVQESGAMQQDRQPFQTVRGNIAQINIEGTMTKRGSSLGGGGTIFARQQVRAALNDSDIAGIFLRIDSPGGTAAGTKDLADDVFKARKSKPVLTFFEDTGASAAYYVGSQATAVRSNASAVIGSIGTVLLVYDLSELAAKEGVKVHVISTGDFKGAGVPGSEVTDAQVAYFQSIVNEGNELFLNDVSRGTGLNLTQVRQLADGRVHLAADAAKLGLIDGVSTLDEALDELISLTSSKRTVSMSEAIAPTAATLSELKTAFPEASAEFLVEQLDKGAAIEQAATAYTSQLQADLAVANEVATAAKAEAEEAKKEAELAKQKMPGNRVDSDADVDGETTIHANATEKWKTLISQAMDPAKEGKDKKEAVVKVDLENPGLREQMLKEWKPQPKQFSQPRV